MGPLVLDEPSGQPSKKAYFSRTFRKTARARLTQRGLEHGQPCRGCLRNVREGAAPANVMRTAIHTQMATTMLCNRSAVVEWGRVAELRSVHRKRAE
ncbi:hypothetical protein J2X36_003088 [Methylobacterium sp. BE186]|nr:hypothetical protein [Methylobacterium sp. BE186]